MPELDSKFDDIEMIQLPDDDEEGDTNDFSISSETEGISDSQDSSKSNNPEDHSSPLRIFKSDREYIDLSEWLDSNEPLSFKFDKDQYKKSIDISDSFDQNYIEYVNSMYKTIEKLTTDGITRLDLEGDDSPIGLITNDTGYRASQAFKFKKTDESFQAIVESLQALINSAPEDKHDSLEFQNLQHTFYTLQCLQANNFYFDLRRKPELILQWVNTFDPKPDSDLLNDVMINNPKPYKHPQFWNTCLSQLIIRGLFTQSNDVIGHSGYQELEETCPELYSIIGDLNSLLENYTSSASKGHFTQWKLLACEFRDSLSGGQNESVTEPAHRLIISQIYDLACIITGLPKTISSYCDTWYEMYLALSLYQIRDNEEVYEDYFKTAIAEHPPVVTLGEDAENIDELSESCFINILEKNYLKALETLHEFDPPTAAYVSELLELKLVLRSYYFDSTITSNTSFQDLLNRRTISEYFLTRHAFDCLNVHDLVPVGIGLLLNDVVCRSNNSSTVNRKTIAGFLPHYHCKTNDDLEWALTICANLNLVSTARELYYQAGVKSLQDGYNYEALNNFVNCYDPTLLSGENHSEGMKKVHYIIWDMIFADSLVNNRPVNDELINNIVDRNVAPNFKIHPVIQQCLSPYAVLKEFYNSLPSKDIRAASKMSKLIHLLQFNYLPKRFAPLLLAQFLPFLLTNDNKLLVPELVVIIELIDSYETDCEDKESQEAAKLYSYSMHNVEEDDLSEYDWRRVVGKEKVPKDVTDLITTLRNHITAKIGKVFIE
ncbi:Nucleoporin NUP85 [Candida viswanathii]|uniref:Nuclear pore complex protein Nup85 n=1 Tax=Candida viswanathii TaxID=5486 RepID=A0A367YFV2_9ASCO|nr:Nucleoporin NUP85 [Candida viswanathii]